MRRSSASPPLAPAPDVTVHLVLQDYGKHGRAYVETDESAADEATIVQNILKGEYDNPLRVVALNVAEGSARDVTEDIARAVLERAIDTGRTLSAPARRFVETFGDVRIPQQVIED